MSPKSPQKVLHITPEKETMTSPGDPKSPVTVSQPLPPQPLPLAPTSTTTKPTSPPTKKPRQRKHADSKKSSKQTDDQQPSLPQLQGAPLTVVYAPPPPRGPVFQPYPGTPYHIMNPSYPVNGAGYNQQHQQQTPYVPPGQPMHPGGPGMAHPPPPQYGYPMHHNPYSPHGYAAYPPQYGQSIMMYPPQRPVSDAPQSSAPSPVLPNTGGGKRKRKSVSDTRGKTTTSEDEAGASGSDAGRGQAPQQSSSASLVDLKKRTKTQRACDSCRSRKIRCDIIADTEPPVCQHCKQYGFECTFFLPITETRFKKKKLEDEADKEKSDSGKNLSPTIDASKRDVGIFGPTSPAHLLHSQATISSRIYENYDLRYNHTYEVSKSGDGLIQVQKPSEDEQHLIQPKMVDVHIERDIIEKLVNSYFKDVAPILPVVTKAELLASHSPSPILLYSMCLVAAGRRDVPQKVFDSIRYAVNTVIKAEDVLSTASITNVQSLLILCMMGDTHSQFVPSALSALWIRLGTAIRMAQDLGLHRAESVKHDVELRRRLWAACLISDRWASLAYGHPYMIDVQDCDARLPSSGDPTDLYMDELVRLSVILGRVLKTIYSPAGLTCTTDDVLYELLADIQNWKAGLPEELTYHGVDTSQHAGLLHLLYACVCMMFWRVFMRISYSCPPHLKFGLTVEQWSELVQLTGEAIDWLDANERVYDVWLIVAYAATSCSLVQYHTWARRKDDEAAAKLRKLRDCTAEIITLLYEATQGPPLPMEQPVLNPTGGVKSKPPFGLDYQKDPTRPGGGVFIAHGKTSEDFKDIPEGVIIPVSPSEGEGASPQVAALSIPATDRNDRDRNLFISSAFAPPLPDDRPFSRPSSQPSSYPTAGLMTPISALRSPVPNDQSQPQQTGVQPVSSPSLVNFTPLTGKGGYPNVNPAMNRVQSAPGNVQVMNVLDAQGGDTLQQFSMADNSFLEGIPGGMFDWGQWDTFFSRFQNNSQPDGTNGANMNSYQQQQQQQSPVMESDDGIQQQSAQQNLPPRFAS